MKHTKPQVVNVVEGKAVKEPYSHYTSELDKITISIHDTYETANGTINLQYEDCFIMIEYDTVVGPDGLLTRIDTQVDELAKAKIHNDYVYVRVTEDMINLAQNSLAKHKSGVIRGEEHNVILDTLE